MLALLALAVVAPKRPLVLAHYMPWFESKPVSGSWGWHWTMGKHDPDKGEIASHYHPLIGPYDSGDPDALECQVLQMKLAGIDGVIIDWYGTVDHYDYLSNDRHTRRLIEYVKKAGLKFAICFEDQTLKPLTEAGKISKDDAVPYAKRLLDGMAKDWFSYPNYVRVEGKPVLMVFGPQYYSADQWTDILAGRKVMFYTVAGRPGPFSDGGFQWPAPADDPKEQASFVKQRDTWPSFVSGAYPRFHDMYQDAGVGKSWGKIEDRDGATFQETLKAALASKAPIAQLITWNDWGEGTVIEPSVEFGYRDLEVVQRSTLGNKAVPARLRLPALLYRNRKASTPMKPELDAVSALLFAGKVNEAEQKLKEIPK